MNAGTKKAVEQYYKTIGINTVFSDDMYNALKTILKGSKEDIIVSDHKLIRGLAKLRGVKHISEKTVSERATQFLAMEDALILLHKKGVPVYFYNRIGMMKNNYQYSDSAVHRMDKKLSFPLMYENIEQYEADLKELFDEKYSKEYVEEIGKIPQVVRKGNLYCHEDYHSNLINVTNGLRQTCSQPSSYTRTIHVYGRCGAFGYAVEDCDTLPSQLQKYLCEKGYSDIRVVNHGLWGGIDEYLDYNFLQDTLGFKEGDIVLFYRKHLDPKIIERYENLGMWYRDITCEYHENDIAKYCFYDKPGHMNYKGYELVAKIIGDDLIKHNFEYKAVESEVRCDFKANRLNGYLKSHNNDNFEDEISNYTTGILQDYPLKTNMENCGSIVMNCNPFTNGHRYLIEYAAKQVERLYIFVVEEDRSFFKFSDRYEMVKNGTADLKNVVVVPSGRFIISAYTFPEYFMKDYVKEKDFDVSMDIETFCKYIAPPLHITMRFVGEEPFDPVTKNYNENMEKILPMYNMQFVEIPRLQLQDGQIINATEVRKLLKNKDFEQIKKYVPDTTFSILKERYADI